jgi:general L-amino acid transport system permease protein
MPLAGVSLSSMTHPTSAVDKPPRKKVPLWAWLAQLGLLTALVALLGWLAHNAQTNLRERNMAAGFDFLFSDSAGFAIGEGWVPYGEDDSYFWALLAGAANTVRVAVPAVIFATLLGLGMGIASVAQNPLLRTLSRTVVDLVRNIPLLVQVLLIYIIATELLPDAESAWSFLGFHLSKGGLILPWGEIEETPFGVTGTHTLSTEWVSLVASLTLYAGAYCSEIVRAGLQSVARGQSEAAHALSLSRWQSLRLVLIPQGLRVAIPPYTSLVLSTIKNSSLGVAIGYPDIVSVANTTMNQTGRAMECIAVIASVYLIINLLVSLGMAVVNRRVAIKER